MKQMKKSNMRWTLLSLPLAGLLMVGMGLAGTAQAGPIVIAPPALPTQPVGHIAPQGRPDLQVRVWVDARSVRRNANNTYNFTIRGQVKNIGSGNYVSRNNQQVLFLHEVGKSHHITNWHFSRLNRGQVKNVHVPVINQPGGEFVPAYELALSFDPDIYLDKNPANDDRNRRNNQATVSSRTLSAAFARASSGVVRPGVITPRPVGVRPGVISGKKPDLVPMVVNANRGVIRVRNIGAAIAGSSKLFVICSIVRSGGRSSPCAAGLRLPNYNAARNTLVYPIHALRPGASQTLRLFGPRSLPRRLGTYGIKLFADGPRRIAESNERNNYTRLDTVIRKKPIINPRPRGKKPDLIPVLRGSNPFRLKFKVKNQGRVTAGASKLVIICKRIGYRGPGGGCADSPSLHRYYDTASNGLVISVPALRAGQTYIPRFRVKGLKWAKGKYKFTLNADATHAVAESNERNNRQSTIRRR